MNQYILNFEHIALGIHCLSKSIKLYYEAVIVNEKSLYLRFFQILENGLFDEIGEYVLTHQKDKYQFHIFIDENGSVYRLNIV